VGAKFSLKPALISRKPRKNLASIELFAPAGALVKKLIIVKPQQTTDLPRFFAVVRFLFLHHKSRFSETSSLVTLPSSAESMQPAHRGAPARSTPGPVAEDASVSRCACTSSGAYDRRCATVVAASPPTI